MNEPRLFPIQERRGHPREQSRVPEPVYMAAYEVYCHLYGGQAAMVDHARGCRGGWGMGEFIAFLYARGFPKNEWRARVDEALRGMVNV